jgi:hypothetical protein
MGAAQNKLLRLPHHAWMGSHRIKGSYLSMLEKASEETQIYLEITKCFISCATMESDNSVVI